MGIRLVGDVELRFGEGMFGGGLFGEFGRSGWSALESMVYANSNTDTVYSVLDTPRHGLSSTNQASHAAKRSMSIVESSGNYGTDSPDQDSKHSLP